VTIHLQFGVRGFQEEDLQYNVLSSSGGPFPEARSRKCLRNVGYLLQNIALRLEHTGFTEIWVIIITTHLKSEGHGFSETSATSARPYLEN
jgi:hypothetical protein